MGRHGLPAALWDRDCELGANGMGPPDAAGGLDMDLLALGLVASVSGWALAPVPFIEIATAGRLLARVSREDPLLAALAQGRPAVSLAIQRPNVVLGTIHPGGGRTIIPFGAPIGSLQAIAHPLAECAIRVDGAELLCWEAAWAHTEDAIRFEMLAATAFAWGSQTAILTSDVSLHTHGGYGYATEYDIQLRFRRARAASSIGGGVREELQTVAERCFDRDGSGASEPLLRGA
jgi:alkylation response protein AidB-like acyl-CoA dehydrogenase